MKKYLFSLSSTLLTVAALFLAVQGYVLIAATLCCGAFFVGFKGAGFLSQQYDFIASFLAVLMLGIVLDLPVGKFPFLTLSVFFAGISLVARMLFLKLFNYNRFAWFEPLCVAFAMLFYVYGNIANEAGWMQWSFPVLFIAMGIWFSFGSILEDKLAKKIAEKGYQAEIGKPAPEFALPDQDGNLVKLSDFRNQRDLLLIFVRGDWCPSCHIMLRTYERNREKFSAKNVMVFAIGPDPVGVNRNMAQRLGIDYKVLSDEGQKTAKTFGVQISDKVPGVKYEEGLPMPAAFLIDKKGIVRYTSRPDRVGEFLDPTTVFPILDALN